MMPVIIDPESEEEFEANRTVTPFTLKDKRGNYRIGVLIQQDTTAADIARYLESKDDAELEGIVLDLIEDELNKLRSKLLEIRQERDPEAKIKLKISLFGRALGLSRIIEEAVGL